jgi:hypothetical protein
LLTVAHEEPAATDAHRVVSASFKSLRKNRLNGRVFPSEELITLRSSWFSANQRLRTIEFGRFAPLGLPGGRLMGTPLGNHLFMPPPSPV